MIAAVVVTVIIVCLQYLKFKKKACQQDKELQLEEKMRENDFIKCQKENDCEMHRQQSRDRVDRLLDGLRDMQEIIRATNDIELFRDFLADCTKLTMELYGKFLSYVATDSEEERNEEIEKAQKEQLLNLLRAILNRGTRNKSLKAELLSTIMAEVGSEVSEWKSRSTHLEFTNLISDQQQSMEARKEAGSKGS